MFKALDKDSVFLQNFLENGGFSLEEKLFKQCFLRYLIRLIESNLDNCFLNPQGNEVNLNLHAIYALLRNFELIFPEAKAELKKWGYC